MPFLNYILTALFFGGLVYWFWKKYVRNSGLQFFFWVAFVLKICCGFAIGYFLTLGPDTRNYQVAAENITEVFKHDPEAYFKLLLLNELPVSEPAKLTGLFRVYSNSFFFSKILSLLNFITGNRYYLNSLFISFFSLAGVWYFLTTIIKIIPNAKTATILAFYFFPSVVLWTSGILKEGILVSALCIFWAQALKLVYFPGQKVFMRLIVLVLMAWFLWKIKYFVAVFVYGITAGWLFIKWIRRFAFFRSKLVLGGSMALFLIGLTLLLTQLHEQFNLRLFLYHLWGNFAKMQAKTVGRPSITFNYTEPDLWSVLINTPKAIWSVLFRPYIWEGDNILYKLAGLENIILFILVAGAALSTPKNFFKKWPSFNFLLLIFCFVLAALFAIASPNLGSLNRYRVTFLPFLIFLLLLTPFWQNILTRLLVNCKRLLRLQEEA